ncbi:family 2A encapsulin nanocompartment cargo protein cysteine desulfurase [Undibacterium sp. TS12]|uniref:family 2A encapsulin nanocompartment cargo protein cysteine desulfurase n=1 Tax=Undibacterium sp. TS12 TaxID=2908202 RepID=UPI001F4C684D|nr:family 2A encapsulin nanocompartment cargo protein cysteine desulfurase [Undibacterium sp. TS12]MCH8619528.1 SufS family cysteine desulfurase [Undibacterium sp. TS12]
MSIQTPTSNAGTAGLPDEAVLNRMAAEFFALVPGAAQAAAQFLPGLSHLHDGIAAPATTSATPAAPLIEPQTTGTAHAPPVADAGVAQGVPAVYAAALPQSSSAFSRQAVQSNTAGSSSYYFLDGGSAAPSGSGLDALAAQATGSSQDQVVARSFGLPGQDQLQRLLGELYPQTSAASGPARSAGGNAADRPAFYFQQGEHDYWDQAPRAANPALRAPFDINAVRRDFPILAERVNGKQLVWFDNAATTQKPQSVIDRISYFYQHENSNIHRAAHELAARATDAYEAARNKVARFLGAASSEEIIFVRGATEAINLIANTFGKKFIAAGDEIIVSQLEHHANIVPWQQLAAEKGAVIRVIPVDDSGQVLLDEYRKLLNGKTRLVAVTQVSNALGTITPVHEITALAHAAGAKVLIDGAQAVSHLCVNVQALDADFYVFSGHKVFGPTGIGVVYGKKALLEQLPPWQGGGNMIADVTFERTQYQPAPARFEAGTGNIADAVGLGAAIDYVERLGLDNIALYEHALLDYATHGLKRIPGVRLIGTAREKASVASFVLEGYQTEEVGKALNEEGIAVRSGHHCAQPILRRFGVEATVRPSFAFYNTCEEIDRLLAVVRRLAQARRA